MNFYLITVIPKGFFPQQDTGSLAGGVQGEQRRAGHEDIGAVAAGALTPAPCERCMLPGNQVGSRDLDEARARRESLIQCLVGRPCTG